MRAKASSTTASPISVPETWRDRRADAFHQAAQHARAADSRGRDHPAEVVVRNVAARIAFNPARHGRRHGAAALDRRVLLQERPARRSDGHRGAHHRFAGRRRRRSTTSWSLALRINGLFVWGSFSGSASGWSTSNASSAGSGTTSRCASSSPTKSPGLLAGCGTSRPRTKLDKDRFRRDMGGLVEAYQEVARRLGLHVDNPTRGAYGPVLVRRNRTGANGTMKGAHHHHPEPGVLDPQGKASLARPCARLRLVGNCARVNNIESEVSERILGRPRRGRGACGEQAPRQHHHRELRL